MRRERELDGKFGPRRFSRMLALFIVAIFLTILILSVVFYAGFERIITNQAHSSMRANLDQITTTITQYHVEAQKVATQVFFDNSIRPLLFGRRPEDFALRQALVQLDNYRFVTSSISSLYLINKTSGLIYVSSDSARDNVETIDSFYDQGCLNFIRDYRFGRPLVPVPRSIPVGDSARTEGKSFAGLSYFYFDYSNPDASDCVVVANTRLDALQERLEAVGSEFGGSLLVIDADGRQIAGTAGGATGKGLAEAHLLERILADSGAIDYFVADFEGKPAFVAFTSPDRNGWREVCITPYRNLTAKIRELRDRVLFSGLLILVLGIAGSTIIAWRLYIPMRGAFSRLSLLEDESRDSNRILKMDFLRGLLEGESAAERLMAPARLEGFGLHPGGIGRVRVIVARIDNYRSFLETKNLGERSALKATAMKAALGVAPPGLRLEAVDMGEDRLAIIALGQPGEEGPEVDGFPRRFQEEVARSTSISLSIAVSDSGDSIERLAFLYSAALKEIFRRFYLGRACIILPGQRKETDDTGTEYPALAQKQLVEDLMSGDIGTAKRRYLEIVSLLSSWPVPKADLAFAHLVFTVTLAIEAILRNNFPSEPTRPREALSLADFETMAELNAHFFGLFEHVASLMGRKKTIRNSEMVAHVTEMVEKGYADRNLCLKSVAGELGISPNHLGRLYRRVTSEALPDRIMRIRMDRARELLSTTDLTIGQVSDAIGFTNDGYFYKAFKRQHGITPAEYRHSAPPSAQNRGQ